MDNQRAQTGQQLVAYALSTYGETETRGTGRNSVIGQMIDRWFRKDADDSLTAWCGIWMAEMVSRCGFTPPKNQFRAKSWIEWGTEVLHANLGSIVVFKFGSRYHVTIAIRYSTDGRYLYCLGANQGNAVNITRYEVKDIKAIVECGE